MSRSTLQTGSLGSSPLVPTYIVQVTILCGSKQDGVGTRRTTHHEGTGLAGLKLQRPKVQPPAPYMSELSCTLVSFSLSYIISENNESVNQSKEARAVWQVPLLSHGPAATSPHECPQYVFHTLQKGKVAPGTCFFSLSALVVVVVVWCMSLIKFYSLTFWSKGTELWRGRNLWRFAGRVTSSMPLSSSPHSFFASPGY